MRPTRALALAAALACTASCGAAGFESNVVPNHGPPPALYPLEPSPVPTMPLHVVAAPGVPVDLVEAGWEHVIPGRRGSVSHTTARCAPPCTLEIPRPDAMEIDRSWTWLDVYGGDVSTYHSAPRELRPGSTVQINPMHGQDGLSTGGGVTVFAGLGTGIAAGVAAVGVAPWCSPGTNACSVGSAIGLGVVAVGAIVTGITLLLTAGARVAHRVTLLPPQR